MEQQPGESDVAGALEFLSVCELAVGAQGLSLFAERSDELVEGLGETCDAFAFELVSDIFHVDAHAGKCGPHGFGCCDVGIDAA